MSLSRLQWSEEWMRNEQERRESSVPDVDSHERDEPSSSRSVLRRQTRVIPKHRQ